MAQKTRSQLKTQSNDTFLDNSTGQIIPSNHRTWNDDTIDSVATLLDSNAFQESTTFNAATNFEVSAEFNDGFNVNSGNGTFNTTINANASPGDAIYANSGNIHLEDGNIQNDNGGLNIGGHTNLNTAFIRKLQNCFASNAVIASTTIDLTSSNGNFVYINGDATIDSFQGEIGQIFYLIFTGNCLFDAILGNIAPPISFKINPNDTLIIAFTSSTTIRVLGIRRGADINANQTNGQNYFEILLPQDALDIANNNSLDIGATYRVKNAVELPKLSGYFWDVILTAKAPNLYNETCYIISESFNGTAQKAWFLGDFEPDSILITDKFDTSIELTYGEINSNAGGTGVKYAKDGAKSFCNDTLYQYFGYVHHCGGGKTQSKNLQDLTSEFCPFGAIYPCKDVLNNSIPTFVPNNGNTADGLFGANYFLITPPTVGQLQSYNQATGSSFLAINSYSCSYQIVNDTCTVYFTANVSSRFNSGASGRELVMYFPAPFNMNSNYNGIHGFGTVRNITDGNHADQSLLVEQSGPLYFLVTAKYSSTINANKTCIISGCMILPKVAHS